MVAAKRLICPPAALLEAGMGVRFDVQHQGQPAAAFVVRWQGQPRAYLNRCGHIPVELDYQAGQFFDWNNEYLICATHGALYDPASGVCLGGRCNGVGLIPLTVIEEPEGIFLLEDADTDSKDTP